MASDKMRVSASARLWPLGATILSAAVACCVSGCGSACDLEAYHQQMQDETNQRTQELLQRLDSCKSLEDFAEMFKSTPWDVSITQEAWKQAVNERQRAWYLREHPELDPKIRSIIEARSVRVGMTADQCRAGWGVPFEVIRTTTAYGTSEIWSYSGSLPGYGFIKGGSLYFDDAILAMIQN